MAFSLAHLKEKAGPLPIWAWSVLTAVAGLGLWYYLRSRNNVANSNTGANATASTDPYSAFANYSAAPTSVTDQGSSGGSSETNTSWLAKAVNWLSTQGFKPLDAQAALLAYQTNGGTLTADQTNIVNKAVGQFGLPPDGVYGIPTGTNPTPPPPASTAATFTGYIKNKGGTISATFSDKTRMDFSNMAAFLRYQSKHPGGWKMVDDATFNSYRSVAQNPTP